uniref:SprT-like domain-containing protein n=1 Tax=Catharus ustulatus TaxID=91951 RepID=A0A8C3XXQ2_CATUS
QTLFAIKYLLTEGIYEHPHGRAGPDHEGRVAAVVAGEVRLELPGRLQEAGEEDVAQLVDVEQRGALDAQLPDGRLHGGCPVLQEQLAGLGGLAQANELGHGSPGGPRASSQRAVRGQLEHQHVRELPDAFVHLGPQLLHGLAHGLVRQVLVQFIQQVHRPLEVPLGNANVQVLGQLLDPLKREVNNLLLSGGLVLLLLVLILVEGVGGFGGCRGGPGQGLLLQAPLLAQGTAALGLLQHLQPLLLDLGILSLEDAALGEHEQLEHVLHRRVVLDVDHGQPVEGVQGVVAVGAAAVGQRGGHEQAVVHEEGVHPLDLRHVVRIVLHQVAVVDQVADLPRRLDELPVVLVDVPLQALRRLLAQRLDALPVLLQVPVPVRLLRQLLHVLPRREAARLQLPPQPAPAAALAQRQRHVRAAAAAARCPPRRHRGHRAAPAPRSPAAGAAARGDAMGPRRAARGGEKGGKGRRAGKERKGRSEGKEGLERREGKEGAEGTLPVRAAGRTRRQQRQPAGRCCACAAAAADRGCGSRLRLCRPTGAGLEMGDEDFLLALRLQQEWEEQDKAEAAAAAAAKRPSVSPCRSSPRPLSVVDEAWELLDPSPDVHALFVQFNQTLFWGKLEAVAVSWSPRMTSSAGICSYHERSGLCSIRLSEPLLKLRPRKDLVETLLHEMIHALLFVTHNYKDRESHGPEFCKHMRRINLLTGANVTIYHNFYDEINLYRQHWWRCNGPCQNRAPYFGYVKRSMNRAPSAHDFWWDEHQRTCGGTFTKVKEPEKFSEKSKQKTQTAKPSHLKSTNKGIL